MYENGTNEQVGEKRNMSALEKKVDALLRFCTAESEEVRSRYHMGLRQLMTADTADTQTDNGQQIDRVLLDMGIPDHLLGYGYLQTAIELSLRDPSMIRNVTYGLYPTIAERYNTRPQLVERAIRHAIGCGWARCDLRMQERYFGGKVDPSRSKPTNIEFVARICNIIRGQYS